MTTDTNKPSRNSTLATLSVSALLCLAAGLVAAFFSNGRRTADIPSAAAEEARIVCANFSGLDRFSVERLGVEETAEGQLQRYRITASCTSQHQVTGTIAIK